ncbi:hypothetical protein ABFS82_03G059000 [Erythranthe guttata]
MENNSGRMSEILGHEYRYRFRVNYDEFPTDFYNRERKFYFFEIRTNFMLKKKFEDEEDVMGSEAFDVIVYESEGEEFMRSYLVTWMGIRLQEYWIISEEEIECMLQGAIDFAIRWAADNPEELFFPVVVDLDICTVQLERETVEEAYDRAIRAEFMYPVYLWANHSGRNDELHKSIHPRLRDFLMFYLAKIRVEGVDQGLSLMEMCSICLRNPTVGSRVSVLPCGHAFHYHCIVRWFIKSNSCPFCRFPAHDFPVCNNLPCLG